MTYIVIQHVTLLRCCCGEWVRKEVLEEMEQWLSNERAISDSRERVDVKRKRVREVRSGAVNSSFATEEDVTTEWEVALTFFKMLSEVTYTPLV